MLSKTFIPFIILSIFVQVGLSQDLSISTQSFFDSTTKELITFLQSSPSGKAAHEFKAPHIEGLEFRTETNDFDLSEQDYTFRVSPTSKKIRKAQRELYNLYLNNPENPLLSTFETQLEAVYQAWVNLYIIDQKRSLSEELLDLLKEKKSLLEKMMLLPEFELKGFVDLQKREAELEVDMALLDEEQDAVATAYDTQFATFNFNELIGVEAIESIVSTIDTDNLSREDMSIIASYEKELIQKELDLELAENDKIFEWGQLAYRGLNTNPFKEVVSIGAAFRWPHDGNNRLKIEELKIKLNQVDSEQYIENEKLQLSAENAKVSALAKIKTYRRISALRKKQQGDTDRIVELLKRDQSVNPLDLLDIREDEIEERLAIIKLLEEVYNAYLDTLSSSRLMYKLPLTNFLR